MSSTSASRFLETNVLVYLFDRDSPQKAERSWEILAAAGNTISTQVLQEFYNAAVRKLLMPAKDARQALDRLAEACRVLTIEVPVILRAAERSDRQRLSFWDALIVEAAGAAGCRVILSEDLQPGREYEPGLRVENPYAGPGGGASRPRAGSRGQR